MKVTISYHDNTSLTVEEIIKQARNAYGKQATVEVMPDSTLAYDLIYHGISKLTAHEQVGLLHDDFSSYQTEIQKLRNQILVKLTEILDQVIIDTEQKVM